MSMRFSELQAKEVICIRDGRRMGYISDAEFSFPDGCIRAVVVPEPGKFWGFGCGRQEFVIPWSAVCRIGPDIVLVDLDPDSCRCSRCRTRFRP